MSTYYFNKLKMEGEASEVDLAKGFIRGKGENDNFCNIDFNKIVPEPVFEPVGLDQDIRHCLQTLAEPCIQTNVPTLNDYQFDTLVTGLRNYRRTGFFASWFWRIAHWGTPWNARSCSSIGKDLDAIYFITKSFPPGNVIEQLSLRFGNLNFILTYYPDSLDEVCQVKLANGIATYNVRTLGSLENSTLVDEF